MANENIATMVSAVVILLGSLLIGSGLYARRRGRLKYRQGAQVLAGFAVLVGASMVIVGGLLLLV